MNETQRGTPLHAAVIGAGAISREHLLFLERSPRARLVGVCDLSPAMAEFARDRYAVEKCFTDHRAMLKELKPDVVHVLTPARTHVSIARDCLEAGCHTLVEKPIALARNGFLELYETARSNGRVLMEDHNYRFNDQILTIERIIASGRLGVVREVEVRMALGILERGSPYADPNVPHPSHDDPAGVLHDFLTHLCYLTLRFMPDPESIRARWRRFGANPNVKYDDLDAYLLGSATLGRIRFSAHTRPDCFSLIVRGSEGWVETDLFQPYLQLWRTGSGNKQLAPILKQVEGGLVLATAAIANCFNKIRRKTPLHGLHRLLERTYHAIQNDEPVPVTFDDMDRSLRLIDSLLAESNQL